MDDLEPLAAPPPATGTGTSTGTTALTVSAVTGIIHIPSTVTGAGVPASTQVIAGPSAGGAGAYTTNQNTTLAAVALTFTPTGSTVFFPDFTLPASPIAGGQPPPPAFPPPSAVPVGPLGSPEPIVPAAVPPSVAGVTQPQYKTGNATTPAANGYFPSFPIVLLNPPLGPSNINAAIFNKSLVPPFIGGTYPFLPVQPPTTSNPALPILTQSAVATIPQMPWVPGVNLAAVESNGNGNMEDLSLAGAVHSGNSRPAKRRGRSVFSESSHRS